MITITAELLHGTIRANRSDPVTGANGAADAEWPPSPARVFSALINGGGSGIHNRIGSDDGELHKLETAQPPLIAASGYEDAVVSEVAERFVVIDSREQGRVQEYPGRKAQAVRAGVRTSPRSPLVTYCWPELTLTDDEVASLRLRAARVGVLGGADSPVRLSVNAAAPRDGRAMWRPVNGGTDKASIDVPVPYPGFLEVLDRTYEEFRQGASPRGASVRRRRVSYVIPDGERVSGPTGPTIWIGFGESVGYRRVLSVCEALRGAVLRSWDSCGFGDAPPVLHGHGVKRGEQHARYLPLPNVGNEHARGQIMGAAIWLPPSTGQQIVEMTRIAVARLRRLNLRGGASVEMTVRDSARRPWATNPARWASPQASFASVFPVIHDRFGKVTDANTLEMVGEWCVNAGLPVPVEANVSRACYFAKLPKLAAREVRRQDDARHPYSHVTVRFDRPLAGPLVIGRGRSFGLGLLAGIDKDYS